MDEYESSNSKSFTSNKPSQNHQLSSENGEIISTTGTTTTAIMNMSDNKSDKEIPIIDAITNNSNNDINSNTDNGTSNSATLNYSKTNGQIPIVQQQHEELQQASMPTPTTSNKFHCNPLIDKMIDDDNVEDEDVNETDDSVHGETKLKDHLCDSEYDFHLPYRLSEERYANVSSSSDGDDKSILSSSDESDLCTVISYDDILPDQVNESPPPPTPCFLPTTTPTTTGITDDDEQTDEISRHQPFEEIYERRYMGDDIDDAYDLEEEGDVRKMPPSINENKTLKPSCTRPHPSSYFKSPAAATPSTLTVSASTPTPLQFMVGVVSPFSENLLSRNNDNHINNGGQIDDQQRLKQYNEELSRSQLIAHVSPIDVDNSEKSTSPNSYSSRFSPVSSPYSSSLSQNPVLTTFTINGPSGWPYFPHQSLSQVYNEGMSGAGGYVDDDNITTAASPGTGDNQFAIPAINNGTRINGGSMVFTEHNNEEISDKEAQMVRMPPPYSSVVGNNNNNNNDIMFGDVDSEILNTPSQPSIYDFSSESTASSIVTSPTPTPSSSYGFSDVSHHYQFLSNGNSSQYDDVSYREQQSQQIRSKCDEPIAILTKKENSCPFVERRINLSREAKVGRSIGRTRPSSDNAIFDCKVLSRNHALLWYQDGKFYLKDAGSSNGTFVNNQRLPAANEKPPPQVLYSGDIIQFGVEVTEKKNIHSCVIGTIRLFHPDGTEAKKDGYRGLSDYYNNYNNQFINYPNSSINVPPSQLINLSSLIKLSMRKQALLESQLESIKQVMKEALESAQSGWRSSVEEDRLLSRIQTLQEKLAVSLIAKNEDAPRENVIEALKQGNLQLISDKETFESASKRCLQNALDEKLSLETNLKRIRIDLDAKNEECKMLKDTISSNIKEMKTLAQNCDKIKKEKDDLISKLKKLGEEDMKSKQKIYELKKQLNKPVTSELSVQTINDMTTQCTQTEQLPLSFDETFMEQIKVENADNRICSDQPSKSKQDLRRTELLIRIKDLFLNYLTQLEDVYLNCESNFQNIIVLCYNKLELFDVIQDKIDKFKEKISTIKQNYNENIQSQNSLINKLNQEMDSINSSFQKHSEKTSQYFNDLEKSLIRTQKKLENLANKSNNSIGTQTDSLDNDADDDVNDKKGKIDSINHVPLIETEQKLGAVPTTAAVADETVSTVMKPDLFYSCGHCSVIKRILDELKLFDDDNDGDNDIFSNLQQENHNDEMHLKLFKVFMKKLDRNQENLKREVSILKDKYQWLSYKNEVSFFIAVLPLFIIFVAIVCAFYPILSYITGTWGS